MTILDNMMTGLETIMGHVGHNTTINNFVEFDKKFIREENLHQKFNCEYIDNFLETH